MLRITEELSMARPNLLKNSLVVSTRLEQDEYDRLKEIAALESINCGRCVTAQQLIRDAVSFVYGDGERLRECFRRTRSHMTKRNR